MKNNYLLYVALVAAGLALAGCLPEEGSDSGDSGSSDIVGKEIGEVEPNDSYPDTQSVVSTVPSTLTGNVVWNLEDMSGDDDVDVFAFVPSETREYTITLKDIGSSDLDLMVYVDDGSYTAYDASPDAPYDGPTETLQMSFDAGVSHYIWIEAFDTPDSGEDYLVTVE